MLINRDRDIQRLDWDPLLRFLAEADGGSPRVWTLT